MQIINKIKEMQSLPDRIKREEKRIALVPTMGFLHKGHISLMKEGLKHAEFLVISIFVNPTQFGPGEDLESYPRNFERDFALAEKAGVNVIFAPEAKEIYSAHFQTYVTLQDLPNHLCGISRPDHFRGVATIVTKLFNIVKPNAAVFGQKDFQQLAVIKQMVSDLNLDIKIIGAPIIREDDGLALSSRNVYLSPSERLPALSLFKALNNSQRLLASGVTDASKIISEAVELIDSYRETVIDYIAVCDPETLTDIKRIEKPVLMALAVKVGKTRLIDNMVLEP
ncbi:pantoate--beta-alanine ligase [Desulfosarcina sp. BuS5]|uniref:pantoate--beta-alanine ligase n=1 Tax=Desulfosarcina sp. BuS5 TaxID=933262 RepID=UPI0004888E70|nr:pantoate--beta-alanine ligase [Desulfosarcina sp. BuS5]